jgi:hypothetical protein
MPYVMCGIYTKEELEELRTKQKKAGYDTSKIFKAKDGRLTFYYSEEIEFNE